MAKHTNIVANRINLPSVITGDDLIVPNPFEGLGAFVKIEGTTKTLTPVSIPQTPAGQKFAEPIFKLIDPDYKSPTEKIPFMEIGNIVRMGYNGQQSYNGTRDPRELLNETIFTPPGMVEVYKKDNDVLEIVPKVIKEPYKQSTITPYGPIRQNESTIRRENVNSMYNLKNYTLISALGTDSTGKLVFSDGESFAEKCVFTGYHKSFIPVKIWKPSQQTKPLDKNLVLQPDENGKIIGRWQDGEVDVSALHDIVDQPMEVKITQPQEVVIPQIFTSKSGYYFTRRPPIRGMFLGYNDADLVPDVATFQNVATPGTKFDPNDPNSIDPTRVRATTGATSYKHNRKIHFFNDRISENILHHPLKFANFSSSRRQSQGSKNPVIDEDKYAMTDKEQVMYSKENTSLGYKHGSHRTLLNSLSKVDIIEYKTIKNRYGTIVKPQLKRRIEQYGPNPLQHLFYMENYDWRKYTTTYIPEDEYMMKIIEPTSQLFAQWSPSRPIDTVVGQDPFSEFKVSIFDNFFNQGYRGRWEITSKQDAEGNFFFKDTTYILDIYFGLMEMHLKSFSWQDIMSIVDMIPEFTSPWNDRNWEKLPYWEKNEKRFSELDNNLKPIWELIKKVLGGVDS